MTRIPCSVDTIKPLTDTVIQVLIRPKRTFHYQAGQYLTVITREGDSIPFSIANAPLGGQHIELHIRHTKKNLAILSLLEAIKQSGKLVIEGPFGHCIYQDNHRPTLLLAGGTGFAPHKAIIEQALAQGRDNLLHLYWGARAASDLYMHELCQHWACAVSFFCYTPVLSQANTPWQGKTGLVHQAVLKDYPNLSDYEIYAAGPPDMVDKASIAFQAAGLALANFFRD